MQISTERPPDNIPDPSREKRDELERENLRLKNKLEELEKKEFLTQLAGDAAHDLNNLLSAMTSYPDFLLTIPGLDEKIIKGLTTISYAGKMAADIVSDLHTLTRGMKGGMEEVEITGVIMEFAQSHEIVKLKQSYPDIDLEIRTDPGASSKKTLGWSYYIRKAVTNLLKNAFEATSGSKGQVRLTVSNRSLSEADHLVVTVRDKGPELQEEEIKHLFDPFYIKKTMKRNISGLALSAVKHIMREHEGHVSAKTGNAGNEISLFFPVASEKSGGVKR